LAAGADLGGLWGRVKVWTAAPNGAGLASSQKGPWASGAGAGLASW